MVIACLIAAREYYLNYQIDHSLNLPETESFGLEENAHENILSNEHSASLVAPCVHETASAPIEKEETLYVSKGDTISTLLKGVNITKAEIEAINKALKGNYNSKDLKLGQPISVKYRSEGLENQLISLEFKPNLEKAIVVKKTEKGSFETKNITIKLNKILRRFDGRINSNFYSAALKLGIPANIIKEAIKALSYAVNFQHGIKNGDPFELLFEEFQDSEGKRVKVGNLKYISVVAKGQLHRIYSYAVQGTNCGYYNAKGESVVRSLLQNPLDAKQMRVTSNFGNRMHPIRGFTCKHKGIDFGAPHGTAVMSAGDGVVVKAGYFGGYGNYILIKHSGGYQTAYAHLSKISSSIRPGAFVKQGQHIGNVGSTGSSTGPHLHHEVIYNNTHINPLSVKALPTARLGGKEIQNFNKYKQEVETQIVGLPMKNQLASSDLKVSTHS